MDARSILIVVIILFLLYYVVSSFLTSSGLTRMGGAEEEITVPASKMRSGGSANSSYSIWFYVDDWATRYGEEKVIFERGGEAATNGIQVVMGAHTNDLIVKVSTLATGGSAGTETGNGRSYLRQTKNNALGATPGRSYLKKNTLWATSGRSYPKQNTLGVTLGRSDLKKSARCDFWALLFSKKRALGTMSQSPEKVSKDS